MRIVSLLASGTALVWALGQGAQLVAVPISAAFAIAIEIGVYIAPRRWRWARRCLEPGGMFEGVWVEITKVADKDRAEDRENAFAVITVRYADGKYSVHGRANDPTGTEHSRWDSSEEHDVTSSQERLSMNYVWTGTLIPKKKQDGIRHDDIRRNDDPKKKDLKRDGFCWIKKTSDDSGNGAAAHVSMELDMVFDIERVTSEAMKRWNIDSAPDSLRDTSRWDEFAGRLAPYLAGIRRRAA